MGLLLEAAASGWVVDGTNKPVEGAMVAAHSDQRMQAAGPYGSLAGGLLATGDDRKFATLLEEWKRPNNQATGGQFHRYPSSSCRAVSRSRAAPRIPERR